MAAKDRNIVLRFEVNDKGVVTNLKSMTKGISDIKIEGQNAQIAIDKLTESISKSGDVKNIKNIKVTSNEYNKLSKSVNQASRASGSASAATLELGRVISDSNYGIRGMANNVSQLASNILYGSQAIDKATGKVVGFSGVMKGMWKSIMGPLGILLAIQALVAIVEAFSMRTKEAAFSLSEIYGKSIKETSAKLILLKQIINDNNISLEQKQKTVLAAKEELEKLGITVDETATSFDDLDLALEEHIRTLIKVALAEGFVNAIKEEQNKVAAATIKTTEEATTGWERWLLNLLDGVSIGKDGLTQFANANEKAQDNIAGSIENSNKKIAKAYEELTKKLPDGSILADLIWGKDDKKKPRGRKAIKLLKENFFSLEKEVNGFRKRYEKAITYDENRLFEIQKYYERESLKLKFKSFVDKQKLRLEENQKLFDLGKINEKTRLANETTIHNSLLDAQLEYETAKTELEGTQSQERTRRLEELAVKEYLAVEKARRGGEEALGGFGAKNDSGVDRVLGEMDLEETKFANKMFFLEQEIIARKLANKTFADLSIKQTNLENANEQQKYELKQKLEASKLDVVKQGLQFAIQVAEEGSAVGKASSVALATISTYEAATAALGAKPYGPWNIAQAAIVTAMGIANVQKIISTKTPGNKGGGGSAPSSGRTFDFNLAGSTGQNQLAQTIGGQVAQPIKAYVVSSEITNQQQFDNQIQGEVTIG
jgi:uncharacterized protein with GYD domain